MEKSYDYIIAGSGLAGLSLLYRILREDSLKGKKILVVDSEKKTKNDRTWCYWEKGEGLFEPIVHFSWDTLSYFAPKVNQTFKMDEYKYKMILGDQFYSFVLDFASQFSNVTFLQSEIKAIETEEGRAFLKSNEGVFEADFIFNSTPIFYPEINPENSLLQHFMGWKIRTHKKTFDPSEATLMDFTLKQTHGTTFMYVLPTSEMEALVEYTLFTEEVLEKEEYKRELTDYIENKLDISDYEIVHDEFGVIPMSLAKFNRSEDEEGRIINIGTAGGFTKASTGYTFYFVQKHLEKVVENLSVGKSPLVEKGFEDKMYDWYDRTLLDVLLKKKMEGRDIFTKLFTKVKPESVMAFLANESSSLEEFKIRHSLPPWTFASSGMKQLISR